MFLTNVLETLNISQRTTKE